MLQVLKLTIAFRLIAHECQKQLERLFVSGNEGKDCMQLYPANVQQKLKLCLVWLLSSLLVIAFFVGP